jgi:DNA-binding NarL/FixJ family response regulator
MLQILIGHAALAAALGSIFGDYPGDELPDSEQVVVTTTADTSPDACRVLSHHGSRVVVLSSSLTRNEQSEYLGAGAVQCLEMTADATALVDAVRRASSTRTNCESTQARTETLALPSRGA